MADSDAYKISLALANDIEARFEDNRGYRAYVLCGDQIDLIVAALRFRATSNIKVF